MTGYIYFHINKLNNKIYVGQTIKKPEYRWGNGKNYFASQSKITRAIKKYGWDGFHHFVFKFENTTRDKLNEIEVYWIKTLDTMNNGYNLTTGGHFPIRSKESLLAISKPVNQYTLYGDLVATYDSINEAQRITGIYTKVISENCRGNYSQGGGYIWRYASDKFDKFKFKSTIVYQYSKTGELINKWERPIFAERSLGIFSSSIAAVCKRKRKSAGGFVWRYEGEDF